MTTDMHRSSEYLIDMPNAFPEAELVAYMAFARRVLLGNDHKDAWSEFAGASNLLAWRYRTCWEDWRSYRTAVEENRNARTHEEVYQRERALFGMFTAGVSCIDAAAYSLAALASHPHVLSMPFSKERRRNCSPAQLLDWLAPFDRSAELRAALRALVDAREWKIWSKLRHRMSHRSNLPQIIKVWIGPEPEGIKPISFSPTSSTPEIDADIGEFDQLHRWLSHSLASLLTE